MHEILAGLGQSSAVISTVTFCFDETCWSLDDLSFRGRKAVLDLSSQLGPKTFFLSFNF